MRYGIPSFAHGVTIRSVDVAFTSMFFSCFFVPFVVNGSVWGYRSPRRRYHRRYTLSRTGKCPILR